MDRGLRRLLAAVVLLGGVGAALAFRHPSGDRPPVRDGGEKVVLRKQVGPAQGAVPRAEPALPVPPAPAPSPPAPLPLRVDRAAPKRNTLAPMDAGQPPPALAPAYPHARPGPVPERIARAVPVETGARKHRVADGDTLEALAERYLGSASLAVEIFEANRTLLRNPQLLPIGAELTIPPRGARRTTTLESIRRSTLAPIPRATRGP